MLVPPLKYWDESKAGNHYIRLSRGNTAVVYQRSWSDGLAYLLVWNGIIKDAWGDQVIETGLCYTPSEAADTLAKLAKDR
jgi:hypothetical protein